jgi:putative DNA primase/helicase
MDLTQLHTEYLARRGITDPAVIAARGYESVSEGLRIPIHGLPDGDIVSCETRLDQTPADGRKFTRRRGEGNRLNVNPITLDKVRDIRQTLFIVEGATRADALAQLGVPAISLTGCWGWMDAKRGTLPDFRDVPLRGRKVVWVPDGDAMTNPDVNQASHEFIAFMERKGASVQLMDLPEDQGLDDWLATGRDLFDIAGQLTSTDALPQLKRQPLSRGQMAEKKGLPSVSDAEIAETYALSDPTHSVRIARTDMWYAYSGGCWIQDQTREGLEARASLARHLDRMADMYLESGETDGEKAVAGSVATDLRSASRLNSVHTRYKALPADLMTVEDGDFDRDPYLLNVKNGTLDLRTGTLRPHDPADRLRGMCPTPYVRDAPRERWDRFMSEVFPGRQDVVDYLQLILGAGLIGRPILHILPVFIGTGRNGKGTLIRALTGALGRDYMGACDNSLLISSKFEGHLTKVMALKGKRIVTATETEAEDAFAVAALKRYTGGDELSARNMRENQTTFMPTHSMILQTNHLPKVDVEDVALWARLRRIEFTESFVDTPELDLDETLASEAEGILSWLVTGCLRFLEGGASEGRVPDSVEGATTSWKVDADQFLRFASEVIVRDPKVRVRKNDASEAYRKWCDEQGERPEYHGTTRFGQAMVRFGLKDSRGAKGVRYWDGIRLEGVTGVTEIVDLQPSPVTQEPAGQSDIVTQVTEVTEISDKNIGTTVTTSTATPSTSISEASPTSPTSPTPPDLQEQGDTACPDCGLTDWTTNGRLRQCVCGYCGTLEAA